MVKCQMKIAGLQKRSRFLPDSRIFIETEGMVICSMRKMSTYYEV